MKQLFVLFSLFLCINVCAQITTGRVRWKSASNIYYTYTGELKDGKPHGRGFAISEDKGDAWIHVFGEFKDGMIDGSTVILHSTGRIVVAKWKENKPEGTGVMILPGGNIDYGNFVNGKMEGKVTNLHNDNTIIIQDTRDGKTNGRAIMIFPDGKTITDRIYVNDTADGPGYQYDTKSKTMFEGIWKNGEWVKETTGNYPSFMRNKNFGSYTTEDQIFIFSDFVKKDGKEEAHDTCFLYDIKKNNRWFGYFDHDRLTNGIRLLGDSIRTIGQFNESSQMKGFCIEYKLDKYLLMGNFKNNVMDGPGISVDIDDSTIYDGMITEGSLTGSGIRLMKNKEIRIGNFSKGRLDGEGKTIFPDGRSVSGSYEDGKISPARIKEVIKPDGKKIDHKPKDICTAINFLLKEWENNFSTINSGDFTDNTESRYESWYSFPQGYDMIVRDVPGIDGKPHDEYSSEVNQHGHYDLIKSSYDDLCKEIAACAITSLAKGTSLKLVSKINKLPDNGEFERIASFFTIPAYPGKKHDPQIRVMVETLSNSYRVTLDIISKRK
ncbi:MAG: hypothetical protein ACRDEB_09265 [Chitinophagaceae bacterium]